MDAEAGRRDPGGASGSPEANWYPDPQDPSQVRYWDGSRWTEWTNPAPGRGATPDPSPASPPAWGSAGSTPYKAGAAGPAQPGQGPYGGAMPAPPGQGAAPAKPVAKLGRAIGILMLAGVGLSAIAVMSDGAEISLLNDLAINPESVSEDRILASDGRQALIGVVQILLLLGTAIPFLVWFHRLYSNPWLDRSRLRHTPGWAVGAWFVPILNLFRPKQMMDDIWRASEPAPAAAYGQGEKPRVPGLLHAWWALWIISVVAGQIAFRLQLNALDNATTLEEIRAASSWLLLTDLIEIPLAIVAFLVVTRVTRRVEARGAQMATPGY